MLRLPVLVLAAAFLMTGCAGAPRTAPAAMGECSKLDAEIAHGEQAKRQALEKQQGAWKSVVPFVVAGQYAAGKFAAADADRRLNELRAESAHRGC